MTVVVLLRRIRRERDPIEELLRRDHRPSNLSLLFAQPGEALDHRHGNDRRTRIGIAQALCHQIAAQLVLELDGSAPARLQEVLVLRQREAVTVAKLGDLEQQLLQIGIRNHDALARSLFDEQPALNQPVEHDRANLRTVEQRGVGLIAEHLAHLLLLSAQRLAELRLRDPLFAHRGNRAARTGVAEIGIDAEKGEGDDDGAQDPLDYPFLVADEIEHENLASLALRRRNERRRTRVRLPCLIWRSGRDSNPRPPA